MGPLEHFGDAPLKFSLAFITKYMSRRYYHLILVIVAYIKKVRKSNVGRGIEIKEFPNTDGGKIHVFNLYKSSMTISLQTLQINLQYGQ